MAQVAPDQNDLPSDIPGGTGGLSLLQQYMSGGGAAGPSAPAPQQEQQVFMGWSKPDDVQVGLEPPGDDALGMSDAGVVDYDYSSEKTEKTATVDEAAGQIYNWSKDRLADFKNKAMGLGLVDPSAGITELQTVWKQFVQQASGFYSQGKKLTPMQVMEQYSGGALTGAATKLPKEKVTLKRTQVDRVAPESAKAMLSNALMETLGREPTEGEYQHFMGKLREAEANNPTVSTRERVLDPNTGETSVPNNAQETTQQGLDAGAYTKRFAEGMNPQEQAAYQAAGYYTPILMNALGAPT